LFFTKEFEVMKELIAIASLLTMISVGANADTQMYGNLAVNDHREPVYVETTGPYVETTGSIGASGGEHALSSPMYPIQDQGPTAVGDHHGHNGGFASGSADR
jgi:hypothetical protein